jgi:hypothetical protein
MTIDSSMPPMIGALRARVSEPVRRSNWSEMAPPSSPPKKPHSAGYTAATPACRMVRPRSLTR